MMHPFMAAVCVALALMAAWITGAAAAPNIVFILADDMEPALVSEMPQVAEMRRTGTTFTRAYVTTPVCAPSRATILTGRYAHNTGVRSNGTPFGGYQQFLNRGMHRQTFAVWLRNAGYRTALIGKYINAYPGNAGTLHIPPGWDEWVTPINEIYIHQKYWVSMNENGARVAYRGAPDDYVTQIYTRKAVAFIRASAAAGRPFALYLSPPSPHDPWTPELEFSSLFPARTAPRGPAFQEADVGDKPPFLRRPLLTTAQVAQLDDTYRKRLRLLMSVDKMIRSIRAALAESGVLANTYLIFASDNGWHAGGEHRLMPNKTYPYDTDLRVPLVMVGPGIKAGAQIARLVGNADFAPTFAAWARTGVPVATDGRSLVPLLTAANPATVPWRKRLPVLRFFDEATAAPVWPVFTRRPGPTLGYSCLEHLPLRAPVAYRGLRGDRYTYVEYDTGDMMLFDNLADPYQLDNQVCQADAGLLSSRHRLAVDLVACAGATCQAAEDR